MKFGKNKNEKWPNEAESLEKFKNDLTGWQTVPGDRDYCPKCWRNMDRACALSDELMKGARPTLEFVEKRKGTDGWSVICNKDGEEVFAEF